MKCWDDDEKPQLGLESVLFTMGGCFAKNLRERLRKAGLRVYPHTVATGFDDSFCATVHNRYDMSHLVWYTPMSIMQEVELAFGEIERIPDDFWRYGGHFQDYYRRQCLSRRREWLEPFMEKIDDNIREGALTADAFIFALGHIESWRSKTTGRWACLRPIRDIGKWAEHVVLTKEQVEESLKRIVSIIRAHRGGGVPVIFMVAPVRMVQTFRKNMGIVAANRQSKNRLLAAAKAVCEETDALYFPAYEIIMNVRNPHVADKIHIRQPLVQKVVSKFLRDTGVVR